MPNWKRTHWGVMLGKCSEHSLLDLSSGLPREGWRRAGGGKAYYVAVVTSEDRPSGPSVNVSR